METKSFSIGEAISSGWEKFKGNIGFFIALVLIVFLIGAILSSLQTSASQDGNAFTVTLFSILSFVVNSLIALGIVHITLKFADGKVATFNDLFLIYPLLITYLISAILYVIIVSIGLILFIIPGIYLAIRFQFFGFFIIDKNVDSLDSLRQSWYATSGVTGALFLFNLALLGIIILGAIALGIGLLVALPVAWLSLAYAYRQLQPQMEAPVQERPAT